MTLERCVDLDKQRLGQTVRRFLLTSEAFDLAAGVVIGTALSALISSIIQDLVLPVMFGASNVSLRDMFVVMRYRRYDTVHAMEDANLVPIGKYATLADAVADGVDTRIRPTGIDDAARLGYNTFNWGRTLELIINFIMAGLILSLIVFGIHRIEYGVRCRTHISRVKQLKAEAAAAADAAALAADAAKDAAKI